MIKPMHLVVLVIVILIVFGAAKLPDIARSIGQSAKILKKEMKDLTTEDNQAPAKATAVVPEANPASTPPATTAVATPSVTDDNGSNPAIQ